MYFHRGFTKQLRKIPTFPTRLKENVYNSKPGVAFYHHDYIKTDFWLKNLHMEDGFEIFTRHNPQVVGFFTPGGWEFLYTFRHLQAPCFSHISMLLGNR